MPIVNVDLSNSLEFFRTITNQCISALNYITNNSYITTGSVRINPLSPVPGIFSLNVSNGLIYGNASQVFSIPFSAIPEKFLNSQLQNTAITITSGTGIESNGSTSLGTSTVFLVSSGLVDSVDNSSIQLAASANAVKRLLDPVNSIQKTSGRFFPNVGGTGILSYSNGQILLTNNNSIVANTIRPNSGIVISNGAGSITVSANISQGENVIVTYSGNQAITISRSALPAATLTTPGAILLVDSVNSKSTTTGATANALNSISNFIETKKNESATVNAYGRLIDVKVYTNDGSGGSQTFTWQRPTPQANFAYAIVTAIAPGAGSSAANNGVPNTVGSFQSSTYGVVTSVGGGAGASLMGIITAADLQAFGDDAGTNTLTIRIGKVGEGGKTGGLRPGNQGTNGGNVTIGVKGSGDPPSTAYIFHLEGGKAGPQNKFVSFANDANTTFGLSSIYYGVARAFANTSFSTVLMKSSGMAGYPGMVLRFGVNIGRPGGAAQSLLPGDFHLSEKLTVGGQGAMPVHPFSIGDAFFGTYGSSETHGTMVRFIDKIKSSNNLIEYAPSSFSNFGRGNTVFLRQSLSNENSANAANMVNSINYGVGAQGPYSAFDGNPMFDNGVGLGFLGGEADVPGANGGFGYVRIESYVNA